MRLTLATAAVFALLATSSSAQAPAFEYLIKPQVFEANVDGSRSELIGPGVMLRTAAGGQVTVDLSDEQAGTRIAIVPTDLSSGRIALRVEVSVIRAGKTATANFDVLGGPDAQQATFAARDANGKFLVGPRGMPVYATFEVTTRPRR